VSSYPDTRLFIGGKWTEGSAGTIAVVDPATGDVIGKLACAGEADLSKAVAAARSGFGHWKQKNPLERSSHLRAAAALLRARADAIAHIMTLEQGKPLAQARGETLAGADIIDWFAEEGRRTYGRVVPSRAPDIMQYVVKEPVGPVAAFSPWNFPINQAVRKIAAALAAGCSIVLKGPEETPATCAELVRAFDEAGIPAGVVNLVFGIPAEISNYLIAHPDIRKVTFTGSTAVGKQLAALAGHHMKRITLELGGHAPAIVFGDADIPRTAEILCQQKFRNAGQVCISPTRFLVEENSFDLFCEEFVRRTAALRVGSGSDKASDMGPLASEKRRNAVEGLVADAVARGARLLTGGSRIGNRGFFFQPTVLADVPLTARIMHEEPFGPVAILNRFRAFEDALAEANRLSYGLAAYAFTRSLETARRVGAGLEAGMVSINHHGLGLPETPFGGIKDSGYGSEGGSEALEAYLNIKFISQA
jgi:succinate-semialdehyde dehydrogenase/glutarate-semialdehyde dehydrogenase